MNYKTGLVHGIFLNDGNPLQLGFFCYLILNRRDEIFRLDKNRAVTVLRTCP